MSLVVLQAHVAAADEALVKLSPSKAHPVSFVRYVSRTFPP